MFKFMSTSPSSMFAHYLVTLLVLVYLLVPVTFAQGSSYSSSAAALSNDTCVYVSPAVGDYVLTIQVHHAVATWTPADTAVLIGIFSTAFDIQAPQLACIGAAAAGSDAALSLAMPADTNTTLVNSELASASSSVNVALTAQSMSYNAAVTPSWLVVCADGSRRAPSACSSSSSGTSGLSATDIGIIIAVVIGVVIVVMCVALLVKYAYSQCYARRRDADDTERFPPIEKSDGAKFAESKSPPLYEHDHNSLQHSVTAPTDFAHRRYNGQTPSVSRFDAESGLVSGYKMPEPSLSRASTQSDDSDEPSHLYSLSSDDHVELETPAPQPQFPRPSRHHVRANASCISRAVTDANADAIDEPV